MAKVKVRKVTEQVIGEEAEPKAKSLKCKFCDVSAPPVYDNPGYPRCESCYERFPPEEADNIESR